MNRLFACTVLLLAASPAFAADANGYTAQYECRAGGPNCNVDVVSLTQQSCQQTISAGTSWSSINWSNDVICIEAGDHTYKGPLTIRSSGTASKRKVLRYSRVNDNDDEPWNQSGANRAMLSQLVLDGADFWIVHRLTIDANNASVKALHLMGGTNSDNNIFNRMLVERAADANVLFDSTNDYNTLQNSVVRNVTLVPGADNDCVQVGGGSNNTVVNNEIYNCSSKGIYTWANGWADGTVIENNDVYVTAERYSDCNGNLTPSDSNAPCAAFETGIGTKAASTDITKPYRIIHNRVWGGRKTDTRLCCSSGTEGQMVSISDGVGDGAGTSTSDFVLFQNNIISDGQIALQHPRTGPKQNSYIGNLFHRLRRFNTGLSAIAMDLGRADAEEIYLNTVVDVQNYYMSIGQTNGDVRCNVFIDAGTKDGSTIGTGSQVDNNAFYGSTKYTANGSDNNVDVALKTRANSTAYSVGDIVRTASAASCLSQSNSACFLYRVTKSGVSAGSSQSYCTTLGCVTVDGTVELQAVRGPYSYRRKLRTVPGGEVQVVPYASAHRASPDAGACPADFSARRGIGIGD
jgi:hypothetical protein